MATLENFSPEDKELLVSLPYKVGIYISYAEDAEGETDDQREMKALRHCIAGIAKLHEDDALIQEIMKQCLGSKDNWDRWADESFHAPAAASQTIAALKTKAPENTVKKYRAAILEVAGTVARAYGEFGEFDEDEAEGFFGKIIGSFAGLAHDDKGHPMNVSAAEDSAMSKLAAALKI